jgi:aldose 1-epimerase
MAAYTRDINYFGEPAIQAGNDQLELVLVPGWGSNLISLIHKPTETHLLREPQSAEQFWDHPVLFGTPILFPPNRIENGTFTFNGRVYQFEINEKGRNNHIHGFLCREKWEFAKVSTEGDQVVLQTEIDSLKYPGISRQFPHHFVVRMTYILEGTSLSTQASILNKSENSMPCGFGYHTTFCFEEGLDTFSVTAGKQWELNENFVPTGLLTHNERCDQLSEGVNLGGWQLDDAFLTEGKNEAVIYRKGRGVKLVYQPDEHFKHWVVYNADGKQGFVCPEPYTWITNAPNLDLPSSLTGFRALPPKSTITIKSSLSVNQV